MATPSNTGAAAEHESTSAHAAVANFVAPAAWAPSTCSATTAENVVVIVKWLGLAQKLAGAVAQVLSPDGSTPHARRVAGTDDRDPERGQRIAGRCLRRRRRLHHCHRALRGRGLGNRCQFGRRIAPDVDDVDLHLVPGEATIGIDRLSTRLDAPCPCPPAPAKDCSCPTSARTVTGEPVAAPPPAVLVEGVVVLTVVVAVDPAVVADAAVVAEAVVRRCRRGCRRRGRRGGRGRRGSARRGRRAVGLLVAPASCSEEREPDGQRHQTLHVPCPPWSQWLFVHLFPHGCCTPSVPPMAVRTWRGKIRRSRSLGSSGQ